MNTVYAAKRIGVIGSGSMGQALISGWTRSSSSIVAVVRDVEKYRYLEGSLGIEVTEDLSLIHI